MYSKVQLQSRRFRRSKKEGRLRIDTSKIGNRENVEQFIQALEDAMPDPSSTDVSERWERLRNTIYNTARSTFGKGQMKSADWLEARSQELLLLIEEKRRALAMYKSSPRRRDLPWQCKNLHPGEETCPGNVHILTQEKRRALAMYTSSPRRRDVPWQCTHLHPGEETCPGNTQILIQEKRRALAMYKSSSRRRDVPWQCTNPHQG